MKYRREVCIVDYRNRNCRFDDVRGIMDRERCPDHVRGIMDDCFRDKLKGIMDRDCMHPEEVRGIMDRDCRCPGEVRGIMDHHHCHHR
jgi:hypothetical protein